MVKRFSTKGTREPSKKEKLIRAHWQQKSMKLGQTYVYPITISLVIAFFLGLYSYLYRKTYE